MSYGRDRDEFLITSAKQGLSRDTAYKLLRSATTLHRLAVAECNGDYPADNGQRPVIFCATCGSGYVAESFKKDLCPDCYTRQRVQGLLKDSPFVAEFNGDPRGAVLRLHPVGTSIEEMQSGRSRGLYVPPSGPR